MRRKFKTTAGSPSPVQAGQKRHTKEPLDERRLDSIQSRLDQELLPFQEEVGNTAMYLLAIFNLNFVCIMVL